MYLFVNHSWRCPVFCYWFQFVTYHLWDCAPETVGRRSFKCKIMHLLRILMRELWRLSTIRLSFSHWKGINLDVVHTTTVIWTEWIAFPIVTLSLKSHYIIIFCIDQYQLLLLPQMRTILIISFVLQCILSQNTSWLLATIL